MLASRADFIEALSGTVPDKDRVNGRIVTRALKSALYSLENLWVIFLDNVSSVEAFEVLE